MLSRLDHPLAYRLHPRFFEADVVVVRDQVFTGAPKSAGSDNHAHTPERRDVPTVYVNCVFDANGASEAFKLSRHWWIACLGCTFRGGVEDAGVDIVRGGWLFFHGCTFERGRALRDATAKGGVKHVYFLECPGLNKIGLGDYTKYDAWALYPDGRRREAEPFGFARPPVREIHITGGSPVVECYHVAPGAVRSATARVTYPLRFAGRDWTSTYFYGRARFFRETKPAPEAEHVVAPEELTDPDLPAFP